MARRPLLMPSVMRTLGQPLADRRLLIPGQRLDIPEMWLAESGSTDGGHHFRSADQGSVLKVSVALYHSPTDILEDALNGLVESAAADAPPVRLREGSFLRRHNYVDQSHGKDVQIATWRLAALVEPHYIRHAIVVYAKCPRSEAAQEINAIDAAVCSCVPLPPTEYERPEAEGARARPWWRIW